MKKIIVALCVLWLMTGLSLAQGPPPLHQVFDWGYFPPPKLGRQLPRSGTWWVTQSGTGDGSTSGTPMSLATFNSTGFAAGDTIRFTGTFTAQAYLPSGGTISERITYDFTGATMNGGNPRVMWNATSNINVIGGTCGSVTETVCLYNNDNGGGSNVTISGWTYMGPAEGGSVFARMQGWAAPGLTNVLIENNNVQNIGIGLQTQRAITGITVRNNIFIGSQVGLSDDRDFQSDILIFADSVNVLVEGNKIVERAGGAQACDYYLDPPPNDPDCNYPGVPEGGSGTNSMRHNDAIQAFASGATYNQSPANHTYRYNWIEVSEDAIGGDGTGSEAWMQFEGFHVDPSFKIYSNVFEGNNIGTNGGLSMAYINGPGSVDYLYNNTIIRRTSPSTTIRFETPQRLHSRNNVVWVTTPTAGPFNPFPLTAGEESDWNRNFMYNATDCYAQWTGANGSCSLDPMFTNAAAKNYVPAAGSPLIGAADNTIGSEYNKCIAPGATWPNPALQTRTDAWDVGAYCATVTTSGEPTPPGRGRPQALLRTTK